MAYIALKCKLFSPLYFGATSCRLTVDAAATFTHDIKKAFQDKKIMTVRAFNIEGAFDKVIDGWLIKKLWEQGIFLTLIR